MKFKDIPTLDCREKENVKFLITKFNEMQPNVKTGKTYKDFKNNYDKFMTFTEKVVTVKGFELGSIFYRTKHQHCGIYKNGKVVCTIVSQSLNELALKICIYCYYKKKTEE